MKGRSTLTNLLESVSDWTLALDNKCTTSVIYIDFSKAFDMVSHSKLLSKLRSYNITGNLLRFVTDFLSNRSQRTRVGNSLSEFKELISGVIQGSCLGPCYSCCMSTMSLEFLITLLMQNYTQMT